MIKQKIIGPESLSPIILAFFNISYIYRLGESFHLAYITKV